MFNSYITKKDQEEQQPSTARSGLDSSPLSQLLSTTQEECQINAETEIFNNGTCTHVFICVKLN